MAAKTPNPKVGDIFGRLAVSGEPFRQGHNLVVPTVCSCGKAHLVLKSNLMKGASKSCGCWNSELVKERCRKYPEGSRDTYLVWFAMVRRCTNPADEAYINYGGRGITVSKRWLNFENFLKDMGMAPEGLTLERRNNDKDYTKSNCVWVTRSTNLMNKRTNREVELLGQKTTVLRMQKTFDIPWRDLYHRIFIEGLTPLQAVERGK